MKTKTKNKKNFKNIFFIFTIISLGLMTACSGTGDTEEMTGENVTVRFDELSFTGIDIGIVSQVSFTRSPETYIEVTMPDNLMQHLHVDVIEGLFTPTLSSQMYYTGIEHKPHFHIYAPSLDEIILNGFITATEWDKLITDDLKLTVIGSSNVILEIEVETLEITAQGSPAIGIQGAATYTKIESAGSVNISAVQLHTENAHIVKEESGRLDITVIKALVAEVSGDAVVGYVGSPDIVKQVSDNAQVIKLY